MKENFEENTRERPEVEKVVVNDELGLRCRETAIELPEHRRELTGINRIVRKELLESPIKRAEIGPYYSGKSEEAYDLGAKNWPVLDYLTDGRYTSFKNWNHSLLANHMNNTMRSKEKLDDFKREAYFQEVNPNLIYGGNLSVGCGPLLWTPKGTPVFFFGNKNPRFVEYIRSILDNKEVVESLKNGSFKKQGQDSHFGNWYDVKTELREMKPENDIMDKAYEYAKRAGVRVLEDPTRKGYPNLDMLRRLINGESFITSMGSHAVIPVVDHPEVPKLRWCHAEYAVVPTKRSLNVLSFEAE